MDIFNHKRIEKLEKENRLLLTELADLRVKFEEMNELNETVPETCERGPWCKGCEFVRTFEWYHYSGWGNVETVTAYVCGKGKSCRHFVQKEGNND